jgi:hypothetical protein
MSAMLVMVSAVLPPLVRVTVCGALVELTDWIGKIKPAGLSATPPEGTTLDTKASQLPPGAACHGFERGKSKEHVCPVMYAPPLKSTAMPVPVSVSVPPRKVEYTNAAPAGFSSVTKASALPPPNWG